MHDRKFKLLFFSALVSFVAGTCAMTLYTLQLLRSDNLANGMAISTLHARSFEDFLTQNMRISELAAGYLMTRRYGQGGTTDLQQDLVMALRHSPFIRSISVLSESGQIVASSNPANIGTRVDTDSFYPVGKALKDVLRIGLPWSGRDFSQGSVTLAGQASDASVFLPVSLTHTVHDQNLTLLVALNPDHAINHFLHNISPSDGLVEVLRLDGALLMSTDTQQQPGTISKNIRPDLFLQNEFGQLEQNLDDQRPVLTAFRTSRLFPFVVLTHLHRDQVLQHWQTQARTLSLLVGFAVLLSCLTALYFYRRHGQQVALEREAQRLQGINATVFHASTEATLITDTSARIVSVNPAYTRATGYLPQEVIGRHLCEFCPPEDAVEFVEKAQCDPSTLELRHRCKDTSLLWIEVLSSPALAESAQARGYHRIGRNITERKQAQDKLQLAASVFTHTREGIMITDIRGNIIDVNDAFTLITGYERDEVLGKNPRLLSSGRQDQAFYRGLWAAVLEQGQWSGEIWNRHKTGALYAEILTVSLVRDVHGQPSQLVALFSDITAQKMHENELQLRAHFDTLTGLPNRLLLADRMQQAMAQVLRRGQQLVVVFIDLDGFKAINDTHGHEAGDQVLSAVAAHMKQVLREGDTLARLGGDEFVAVLMDLGDDTHCNTLLQRLLDAAAQPFSYGSHQLTTSASLGATHYPQNPQDPVLEADQLLRQADQAMYQAKTLGKNRYCFFKTQPL